MKRNPNKPIHQITSTQLECLRAVADNGDASDWRRNTPNSLQGRGLIEYATTGNPHPGGTKAQFAKWKTTELGDQVLAHWAGKTRTGA